MQQSTVLPLSVVNQEREEKRASAIVLADMSSKKSHVPSYYEITTI